MATKSVPGRKVWEDGSVSKDVVSPFGGAGAGSQGSPQDLKAAAERAASKKNSGYEASRRARLPGAKTPPVKLPNARRPYEDESLASSYQLKKVVGPKSTGRETKKGRPMARGKRKATTFSPQTIQRRLGVQPR